MQTVKKTAKSFGACQPAGTVWADTSEYFLTDALSPYFTEHGSAVFSSEILQFSMLNEHDKHFQCRRPK